jgi:hypothetical protein
MFLLWYKDISIFLKYWYLKSLLKQCDLGVIFTSPCIKMTWEKHNHEQFNKNIP